MSSIAFAFHGRSQVGEGRGLPSSERVLSSQGQSFEEWHGPDHEVHNIPGQKPWASAVPTSRNRVICSWSKPGPNMIA